MQARLTIAPRFEFLRHDMPRRAVRPQRQQLAIFLQGPASRHQCLTAFVGVGFPSAPSVHFWTVLSHMIVPADVPRRIADHAAVGKGSNHGTLAVVRAL
jgi:hypothetical protein